uniref:Uncharacterized protein n=1 Tax=Picea glauca TaxID=3330 RepID=A0A101M0Z5_PICGL|nr:hypothetical protein ABT39_MTgene4310 [Picea glauca]
MMELCMPVPVIPTELRPAINVLPLWRGSRKEKTRKSLIARARIQATTPSHPVTPTILTNQNIQARK